MSSLISLDIRIESKEMLTVKSFIQDVINAGWSVIKDKKITYLQLGDKEMFDWVDEEIDIEEFLLIVDEKEQSEEVVGVSVYWSGTEIGGNVLVYNGNNISFLFIINTIYLDKHCQIPDFNWYSERILPYLINKYHVAEYKFDFTY